MVLLVDGPTLAPCLRNRRQLSGTWRPLDDSFAVLHNHSWTDRVRSGFPSCQQPAEPQLGLGYVRARKEPGTLRLHRLLRQLRGPDTRRRSQQNEGQLAVRLVPKKRSADRNDGERQCSPGLATLLLEVNGSGLYCRGRYALCARQFGDRRDCG
jgi:hypothetical protein